MESNLFCSFGQLRRRIWRYHRLGMRQWRELVIAWVRIQFGVFPFDFEQVHRTSQESEFGPAMLIFGAFGPNSAWDMANTVVRNPREGWPGHLNRDGEEREYEETAPTVPSNFGASGSSVPIEAAFSPTQLTLVESDGSASMNVDLIASANDESEWDTIADANTVQMEVELVDSDGCEPGAWRNDFRFGRLNEQAQRRFDFTTAQSNIGDLFPD